MDFSFNLRIICPVCYLFLSEVLLDFSEAKVFVNLFCSGCNSLSMPVERFSVFLCVTLFKSSTEFVQLSYR